MTTTAAPRILGGFAGPGGWAEGLRLLGLTETGIELDPAACATRTTAGHRTVQADITCYPTEVFAGSGGGIFSPPCPTFSKSGNGAGAHDMPHVLQTIRDLANGLDTREQLRAACLDERSALTAEPMRWLHDLRPAWVCMEQVPAVLPIWELYCEVLRAWGYSAACGVLDAAHYGLGQHRKRAILIASRVRKVALPAATHGGPGQPPLVSMAQVLGWGYTRRPAPTVTGGGTSTGGAEPFGNGTRQAMRRAADRPGEWLPRQLPHLRPTIAECALLQGMPADYPWQGRAGQQHLQVGNLIPPPLAAQLVSAATGIPIALSTDQHTRFEAAART